MNFFAQLSNGMSCSVGIMSGCYAKRARIFFD
jgi:hypothetical protein